jgi:hypothetical protein
VCNGVPKPAGTTCDPDLNACTTDRCDAAGACIAGPCSPCCGGSSCSPALRSCKRSIDGAASVLVESNPDVQRNRVRFLIRHGQATAEEDVGDPTTSSDYHLCFYTIAGPFESTAFLFGATAPAGASWKRTRDGGARYLRLDHAPEGLARIRIRPGADGAATVRVTGSGPLLGVPFPVGPVEAGELDVRLRHAGACWAATLLLDSSGVNDPSLLRAKQTFD